MESCRRTGLSGVLCSLSLLCVILDIQLDGKSRFTLEKNVLFSSILQAPSLTATNVAAVCRLIVIKSFYFRLEVLPD